MFDDIKSKLSGIRGSRVRADRGFLSLPKYKQEAVLLRYNGLTHKEIADKIGRDKQTVDHWFAPGGPLDGPQRELSERLMKKIELSAEDWAKKREQDAKEIWEELKKMALSEEIPPNVRQAAIDSLLDRTPSLSRRTETKSENTTTIKVTEEERQERLNKIKYLQSDIILERQNLIEQPSQNSTTTNTTTHHETHEDDLSSTISHGPIP